MVRSSTITAERMEEIRELVRKYPDSANSPVKHFVFSTTERQLKQTNRFFLYIIIGMGILAVGVAVYVHRLRQRIEQGGNIKPSEWKELEQQLKAVYPRFGSSLYGLYNLSPTEYQLCLLLKIRTAPAEIATVLNKDKSTISSIRKRLYKKVFGKEGTGKDWDEFILSL
jgi:hypothetical protein